MKRKNKTPESQVSNLQLFFFFLKQTFQSPLFRPILREKKNNKLKLMDIVFQNKANH